MNKQTPKSKNWIRYYDDRNIMDEITDESEMDSVQESTFKSAETAATL